MQIHAFIYTYSGVSLLVGPCIRALRRNPGTGNALKVHVIDDSRDPLDAQARATLEADGVTVLETVSPRNGNVRGFAIARELAQIMAEKSKDADVVVRVDPDCLVVDLAAFVKPLVDDPKVGLSGHNFHHRPHLCLGQAYALRKATLDILSSTLNNIDGSAAEFAIDYMHLRIGLNPTMLWEDFCTSALAGRYADVVANRYAVTSWDYIGEQRDPGEVMRKHAVVLLDNARNRTGVVGDNNLLANCAEMLLAAADDMSGPQPVLQKGAKPLVVFGIGASPSDTVALASILAAQPGVYCLRDAFAGVCHSVSADPDVNAKSHWSRLLRKLRDTTLPIWADVSITNAWRAAMLIPYLEASGYAWKIVAIDAPAKDDANLITAWGDSAAKLGLAQESVPLPVRRAAIPVSDGADAFSTQQAVVADYRAKLGALVAAHPRKLRVLQAADLADQSAMAALFDWIGLPAAGRRNELIGAAPNARAS